MYVALGVLLVLHGFAHLVGFASPWGFIPDSKPLTGLLGGRVLVSDATLRGIGFAWLVAALLFLVAAVAVFRREPWWQSFTLYTTIFSLVLSSAFLPEALIGFAIDAALLVLLIAGKHAGWLPASA